MFTLQAYCATPESKPARNPGPSPELKKLVASGGNIDSLIAPPRDSIFYNEGTFTRLHLAAFNRRIDDVKFLIRHGANVNARSKPDRYTPFYCAAAGGSVEVVKLLVKAKADMSLTGPGGATPVHAAAAWNRGEMLRYFNELGAIPAAKDSFARSPMEDAILFDSGEALVAFLETKTNFSPLGLMGQTPFALAEWALKHKKPGTMLATMRVCKKPERVIGKHASVFSALVGYKWSDCIIEAIKNRPALAKPKHYELMHIAAETDNGELARLLLEHGFDVNGFDEKSVARKGKSPLHVAATHNSTTVGKILIKLGANVNLKTKAGTPLGVAIAKRNVKFVRLLLASQANIPVGTEKTRLLHLAAQHDCTDIVAGLIKSKSGLDLNSKFKERSALHVAAKYDSEGVAKLLIEAGADVNIKTALGSPLHAVATYDSSSVAKLLIESQADRDIMTKTGFPLHAAARFDGVEVAKLLVTTGTDVNRVAHGHSPLHMAVVHNNIDMSETLLKLKADVNLKTLMDTPLHLAVKHNNMDMARLLIESGADVNLVSNNRAPLHIAAKHNSLEVAQLLVKASADVDLVSNNRTPLHIAARHNSVEVAQLLMKSGADVNRMTKIGTPLHAATAFGSQSIAELLIANGAKVNLAFKSRTPLHVAAENDYASVSELLLENGADINARDRGNCTPLFLAVGGKKIRYSSEFLVRRGAEVNVRDVSGTTLLHILALYSDSGTYSETRDIPPKIVKEYKSSGTRKLYDVSSFEIERLAKLAIERGADVNAVNKRGETPLHIAAEENGLKYAKLLIEHGATRGIKTSIGLAPVDLAASDHMKRYLKDGIFPPPSRIRATGLPGTGFCDSGGRAYQIIYIIDCSETMAPVFNEIITKTARSIRKLRQSQTFRVLLLHDGKVISGTSPEGLIVPSEEKKLRTVTQLKKIRPKGRSRLIPALNKVFKMPLKDKGAIIFILSDGKFLDRSKVSGHLKKLQARTKKPASIYTYLYGRQSRFAAKFMMVTASQNDGKLTIVQPGS